MTGAIESGRAWRTTGGVELARRVVLAAIEGTPVIVRARRSGAAQAIGAMAEDEFAATAISINADDGLSPTESVAAVIDARGSFAANATLVDLIGNTYIQDGILIVSVGTADPRSWLAFAGVFASARATYRGRAAGLVLLHDSSIGAAPGGCLEIDDDTIVDPLDAFVAHRDRAEWPRTLTAHAAAAALVEACRGDLDQIARLASLRPEQAFEPFAAFAQTSDPAGARPLWWRGRVEFCPFWLAQREPERLRRRIWRGQLSIVFPWLEETRALYLEQAGSQLPADVCDRDTGEPLHVDSYEFAHIAAALGRMGQDRRKVDAAHLLRHARNELAHCRPLRLEDFQRAQVAASVLLGSGSHTATIQRRPAVRPNLERPSAA